MLSLLGGFSLARKLLIAVALLLILAIAVNFAIFIHGYRANLFQAMEEKAASFTATADEAKNHVSKLHGENSFRNEELLAELKAARAAGKDYRETRIFKTIPVVAGWTAAKQAAQREHLDFQIPAFNARSKTNAVEPDSFRGQMLQELEQQAEAEKGEVLSRVDAKTNTLHFMRAIRLTEDCMMCHGNPSRSPTGDGKDVIGFPMENWSVGKMHGAYEVIMPLAPLDAQVNRFLAQTLLVCGVILAVGLGGMALTLRSIFSRPVKAMIARLQDIAQGEGDLTRRLHVARMDELGELSTWFNVFIEKIHNIIAEVRRSSISVAGAASEVAASSEQMARGMSEQMLNVTQITAAVEEMSCSVQEVAGRASDAVGRAKASGDLADQGGRVIGETIHGMHDINEAVQSSANSVMELGRRSEQIGAIIQVIKDIAEQTNLLALNAAIEAARAGEQGRGFAVVADEVRKLAERTGSATHEVTDSIKAIQSETGQAVVRIEQGTEQVRDGVRQSQAAGDSLEQIVNSAREVAGMIESIAAATEEQSMAGQEISKNLEEIANVTRETANGANQAAMASCQLSQEAERLNGMVSQFKVNG